MNHIGTTNDSWAYHLIDQLISQKVINFCIAPGSRSSPLTLAAAQRKNIKTHVHFDERGLGFYALGIAKASKKPVAIIVTSGTAVGNLMPAVMEASQSHLALIVLTADRPMELKDCKANQTTDQTKLFENFVKWQCEISPSDNVSEKYIRSIISYGVFESMQNPKGPIHINCCFKEPLYSALLEDKTSIPTISYSSLNSAFDTVRARQVLSEIYAHQKGLIIVGMLDLSSLDVIISLSKALKWPIYAEVLSRVNISELSDTFLLQLPYLLELFPNQFEELDCIVQFGDRIISKKILTWLKSTKIENYYLITEHNKKSDELCLITKRIITSVEPLVDQIDFFEEKKENKWLSNVKALDLMLNSEMVDKITQAKHLSEHYLYHTLNSIKLKNCCIFLGNSSVIRDANTLFFPNQTKIFANRGVSGIDGNLATAVGIASKMNSPMIAILGDLTFLHDLTSLHLIRQASFPITIFVINNNGGEIFAQLPVVNFQMHFEKFFKTPHDLNFSEIAKFFNLHYRCIDSISELKTCINQHLFQNFQIIELKINSITCRDLRKKIQTTLKEKACSHLKNMESLEITH